MQNTDQLHMKPCRQRKPRCKGNETHSQSIWICVASGHLTQSYRPKIRYSTKMPCQLSQQVVYLTIKWWIVNANKSSLSQRQASLITWCYPLVKTPKTRREGPLSQKVKPSSMMALSRAELKESFQIAFCSSLSENHHFSRARRMMV